MTYCSLNDQAYLIAGNFSEDVAEFFNDQTHLFILSSRAHRHLWLALIDTAPAAAKSALVRFGFDADPLQLTRWVLDDAPPLLWPVLRRCMPAQALSKGWYVRIIEQLRARPRSGRVWCQVGQMGLNDWAVNLALPTVLIEPSVISLMAGNLDRAEAVRDLWNIALDQGGEQTNLRRAICDAKDMESLERLLARFVQADHLPLAPVPDGSPVRPLRTKKELESAGRAMQNCMARAAGFGLRRKSDAFLMWLGDPEGDVMIRCSQDHHMGWWRLSEIRLRNNRPPSEGLRRRIAEAFASVAVRERPDVDSLLQAL